MFMMWSGGKLSFDDLYPLNRSLADEMGRLFVADNSDQQSKITHEDLDLAAVMDEFRSNGHDTEYRSGDDEPKEQSPVTYSRVVKHTAKAPHVNKAVGPGSTEQLRYKSNGVCKFTKKNKSSCQACIIVKDILNTVSFGKEVKQRVVVKLEAEIHQDKQREAKMKQREIEMQMELMRVREHVERKRKKEMTKECAFCKKNGETKRIYSGHCLRDEKGGIVCPILSIYVCPFCGVTGRDAHTMSYCPENSNPNYDRCRSRTKSVVIDYSTVPPTLIPTPHP